MRKPRNIWFILLAATLCVIYWQPDAQPTPTARTKVENEGGIIAGINNAPASAQFSYDRYFIPENFVPNVSVPNVTTAVETR